MCDLVAPKLASGESCKFLASKCAHHCTWSKLASAGRPDRNSFTGTGTDTGCHSPNFARPFSVIAPSRIIRRMINNPSLG
jgi:hypothetical protein